MYMLVPLPILANKLVWHSIPIFYLSRVGGKQMKQYKCGEKWNSYTPSPNYYLNTENAFAILFVPKLDILMETLFLLIYWLTLCHFYFKLAPDA